MLRKYDVLCVGSATLDNYLTIERLMKDVKVGDKVLVTEMERHTGGGATNSAAALSFLGLRVKMLSKLGKDHDAEFVEKEMKKYGVKNICLHKSKKNTDFATLISNISGDRIIYVQKGASRDLLVSDYKKRDLKVKWFYLATLVGKSFKTEIELAKYAQEKKINVLFNPSLYLAKKGKKYLKNVLQATTLLVLNKEEAQALLKNNSSSFETLIRELHRLGPKMVVITNSTKKFYGSDGKIIYSLMPPKVNRVHTAGAGDAFTSGLVAGVIKKWSFADAMALGQANASSLIQKIGTKNGLLTEITAKRLIKRLKIKVIKHRNL